MSRLPSLLLTRIVGLGLEILWIENNGQKGSRGTEDGGGGAIGAVKRRLLRGDKNKPFMEEVTEEGN